MKVRKVVDLSLPLDSSTPVYPGDPLTDIRTEGPDESGFHVSRIAVGSHTGTHCDAPFHFVSEGARIDEVDLGRFAGPAVLVDVRHRGPRDTITAEDVAPALPQLTSGVIVLLWTGWTRHYGTPVWWDHPYVEPAACQMLLDTGVRTIGVDALSIDESIDEHHTGDGWPCHQLVLGAGGVLLENLAHLERIDFDTPFVSALPLRLTGLDGSPVRAAAFDLG